MLLIRILGIVFPVFAIVAAGYVYGRLKRPDLTTVNQLNMDVLLPALLFSVLSSESFDVAAYGGLALGATLVILGSGLLALPVARLAGVQAKTLVPPMMFNNSGNMGLPLAVFAFGPQALPAAVMLLIVENGLHFTLGTWLMDHRAHWLDVLKQPIVVATIAGLLFSISGFALPEPVEITIDMIGQASIPLLLFALGTRMIDIDLRQWRLGLLGAVLCPVTGLLVVLAVRPFLDLTPLQDSLLLLFGALPPAVLNYLVAERYRQEPGKVASIVLIGNLAAFVSIPLVLPFALQGQ
ncbi:transporter [Sulfurifustis variabilis]|uniref:Transporter n=1 Tax=Sulfurifustis variabilis TaxID=1675686 RepID=A0A1B4V0C3_9GAMM|nr:AEC family transporter [Sulfurifustis variabilis]BAU46890.1 transporter [Sulfurifustis variabilis]